MTPHLAFWAFWVAAAVLTLRIVVRVRLLRSGLHRPVDARSGYGPLDSAEVVDSARLALLRAKRGLEVLHARGRTRGEPALGALVEEARSDVTEECARAARDLRSVAENGRALVDHESAFTGGLLRSVAVDAVVLAVALSLALSI